MCAGVFLVVQWLKLPFPTHWDVGLIPSWGAKISTWLMAKKTKYKTEAIFNKAFKNGPHQKKLKKYIYTHTVSDEYPLQMLWVLHPYPQGIYCSVQTALLITGQLIEGFL